MTQVVVLESFNVAGSGGTTVGATVDIDEALASQMVTAKKARYVVLPRLTSDWPEITSAQAAEVARSFAPNPMRAPYARTFGALRSTYAALSAVLTTWSWACLVDNAGKSFMSGALARFYIYFSTDHDDVNHGVRVLYSNSLDGPWKLWLGGLGPDPAVMYWDLDEIGAGPAYSTETPFIMDTDTQRVMSYQSQRPGWNATAAATDAAPNTGVTLDLASNLTDPLGRATAGLNSTGNPTQMTLFARAYDNTGLRFTKHRTSSIHPGCAVTGGMFGAGNHTGYFTASRVGDRWIARSIAGSTSGNLCTAAYNDPLNWDCSIFYWKGAADAFRQAGYPGHDFTPQYGCIVETLLGPVWVGIARNGAPAVGGVDQDILAAQAMSQDMRSLVGGVRILDVFPSLSFDDAALFQGLTGLQLIDGQLVGIVMSGGQTPNAKDNFSIVRIG